jgi:uncharacterized protein YggT (Ycf19 family)
MIDAQGSFWAYQLPNLLIAMMMYTLIGRFLLSLFHEPDSDKVLWRVFKQVSDPVVNTVAAITPADVPERLIYIFAFIWLFVFRIALYVMMRMYGIAPSIAG